MLKVEGDASEYKLGTEQIPREQGIQVFLSYI